MLCLALILNNKDHGHKEVKREKRGSLSRIVQAWTLAGTRRTYVLCCEKGEKCKKKENCFFIKGISCFCIKALNVYLSFCMYASYFLSPSVSLTLFTWEHQRRHCRQQNRNKLPLRYGQYGCVAEISLRYVCMLYAEFTLYIYMYCREMRSRRK